MKENMDFSIGRICLKVHSFLSVFILLILAFTSCTSRPEPYSILEFTGNGEVYNLSKYNFPVIHKLDSANPTAVLASKGDIICYGENEIFYYGESPQSKFSVRTTNNESFVNEKISTVTIPFNNDMIPWFKDMKSTDISLLEFLYFDSIPVESYMPYLTELAEIKPDIGVGYGGDLNEIDKIFKIFNPKFIVGGNLHSKDFNLLSGLTNLEFLSASYNDSVPLPAMPKLRQLILFDISKDAVMNKDLLINNRQIKKLTIMKSGKLNFQILEPLHSLKELIVTESDPIENFDLIRNHRMLEILSVNNQNLPDDMSLKELPYIRWMVFYENAIQDQFDSFIRSHPDLEVVEIINNDSITNLKSLAGLTDFYGLIVAEKLTDLAAVKSLKTLKYLSLPEEILNDTTIKAEFQKSLPGTRIVANQGLCLGSGWLLLIIPFILFIRILVQRKPRKI